MSNTRKLRSPKGTIRVALLSGHVTIITEEPVDVPEIFWSSAYSLGAISGDMTSEKKAGEVEAAKKKLLEEAVEKEKRLEKVLRGLFDNPKGAIGQDKKPLVRKVSALLKEPVDKPTMLNLWNKLLEEMG